jgi:hypothetical protein
MCNSVTHAIDQLVSNTHVVSVQACWRQAINTAEYGRLTKQSTGSKTWQIGPTESGHI